MKNICKTHSVLDCQQVVQLTLQLNKLLNQWNHPTVKIIQKLQNKKVFIYYNKKIILAKIFKLLSFLNEFMGNPYDKLFNKCTRWGNLFIIIVSKLFK